MHDVLLINAVCININRCRVVGKHTNMFPAGVAVLCVEGLEAGAAVGPSLLHDVALAPKHSLALETAEVLHVPVTALCLGALIRKDDLRKERGKSIVYHTSSEVQPQLGYYCALNDKTKAPPPPYAPLSPLRSPS